MPTTKMTRRRWKDHLEYGKWIYVALAVAAIFVSDLLYTTTQYRPPNERSVAIQLVGGGVSVTPEAEAIAQDAFAAVAGEKDASLEEVSLLALNFSGTDSDYYGAQKFFVELAAGENDIFAGDRNIVDSIVAQGGALPLEDFVAAGYFTPPEGAEPFYSSELLYDDNGDPIGRAERRLYGYSLAPMQGLAGYAYLSPGSSYFVVCATSRNPEASLMVMQELYEGFRETYIAPAEGGE